MRPFRLWLLLALVGVVLLARPGTGDAAHPAAKSPSPTPTIPPLPTVKKGSLASVRYIRRGLSVTPPHKKRQKGKLRMSLYNSYDLQTAARQMASMNFADGTLLHMNQRTDAVLRSRSVTTVKKGEIAQVVVPGTNHRVQTSAAVASAVGTMFDVRFRKKVMTVIVIEGAVLVKSMKGKKATVVVKSGQETTVKVGKAPTPPKIVDAPAAVTWTTPIPPAPGPPLMNIALDANGGQVADVSSQAAAPPPLRSQDAAPASPWDARGIIDGKLDSGWSSAVGQNKAQWIKLAFADLGTYPITEVLIDPAATGGHLSANDLNNFTIKVSTTGLDEADFTTVFRGSAAQQNTLQIFPLPANTTARYVELRAIDNYGGDAIDVAELEVVAAGPALPPDLTGNWEPASDPTAPAWHLTVSGAGLDTLNAAWQGAPPHAGLTGSFQGTLGRQNGAWVYSGSFTVREGSVTNSGTMSFTVVSADEYLLNYQQSNGPSQTNQIFHRASLSSSTATPTPTPTSTPTPNPSAAPTATFTSTPVPNATATATSIPYTVTLSSDNASLPAGAPDNLHAAVSPQPADPTMQLLIQEVPLTSADAHAQQTSGTPCPPGPTCTVAVTKDNATAGGYSYTAVLKRSDGTVLARSSSVTVTWTAFRIQSFTASATNVPLGTSVHFTAVLNQPLGPSTYGPYVGELRTQSTIKSSCNGTTCGADVQATTPGAYVFVFVLVDSSGKIVLQSDQITVYWQWTISLSADHTTVPTGTAVTLTAQANADVAGSGYQIVIVASTQSQSTCSSGATCTWQVASSSPGSVDFEAYIVDSNGNPVTNSGQPITVTWQQNWSISLSANPPNPAFEATSTLTATANQDVSTAGYHILIEDAHDGYVYEQCSSGTTCSVDVPYNDVSGGTGCSSQGSGSCDYVALISDGQNIIAQSNAVTITWSSGFARLATDSRLPASRHTVVIRAKGLQQAHRIRRPRRPTPAVRTHAHALPPLPPRVGAPWRAGRGHVMSMPTLWLVPPWRL